MPESADSSRLPRNFHRTFKPERRYLSAMLRYAATGQGGDYQSIAVATGIPTGASTGKVPAILDYCRGMGLVKLVGPERSSVKRPELTAFGRIVLLEDPYLKTTVSQWIAHLNLCSSVTGADVWYQTFHAGAQGLGTTFARSALEEYLSATYGVERTGLIGPLIGTYEDDAAFKLCGALSEEDGVIVRKPAPITDDLGLAYGAWMTQLITVQFPGQQQVPITTLDSVAGWRTIPGWDIDAIQRVLSLVERKGIMDVDRHMDPWLLIPKVPPDDTWKLLYSDMV